MSDSSFDKNLKKAEDAVRKNNADYAIVILNTQLLKTQPDHPAANELYYRAVRAKWKATGKMPKPAWLKTKKLQAIQLTKRWEGLSEAARLQYADDPANGKVLELIAEANINLSNFHAAYEALKQLTEGGIDAKSGIGWFWKAKCQDKLGDVDSAIESLDRARAIDRNKEVDDYYKNLTAKKAYEANKDKKGVGEIVGADKLQAVLEEGGRKQMTGDRLQQLIDNLGGIEGASEKNDIREVGRLYDKAGKFANAVKAWKKYFEITNDPEGLDSAGNSTVKHYQQLVEKSRVAGNPDKEKEYRTKLLQFRIQEWKRRVDARPTDNALHFQYGGILYESGKFSEAAKELQKASKDPKQAASAALMLGRSFYEIGRHELADRQFKKAMTNIQSDEDRLATLYWMAKSRLANGDKEGAREQLLQIQMEDFDFRDVQDILDSMGD